MNLGQLKQLISYIHVFNQFKIAFQFFKTASSFLSFDGPNAFFKLTGPWLQLRKGRKIPALIYKSMLWPCTASPKIVS